MDPSPTPPPVGLAFEAFIALIARLRAPGGCPWDREQTHVSLKPMTIEEAYEVLEAIDEGGDVELAGELGDLLLQVVFHSQIAADEGRFTIADVIARVSEKMVRRHPHVFADKTARTSGDVLRNWEAIKEAEQAQAGKSEGSMLDSVSSGLPAAMEAYQMTTKASRVGFDWPDAASVLAKLDEETAELRQAVAAAGATGDATTGATGGAAGGAADARVAEELGDLLFAAVNVARLLGHDPESALKAANRKFRRRFRHIEERLRAAGGKPSEATLAEMDALWEEAKARESL